MNLKELKELIEVVSEKGFAEFEVERQGFRLRISHFRAGSSEAQPARSEPAALVDQTLHYSRPEASAGDTHSTSRAWPEPGLSRRPSPAAEIAEPTLHVIKSPIVGTFYRASSPTSESFVKVGDPVGPDTVVCIIEAMKLMNEIQADITGEVAQVYAENGQAVEYDQPLFGIRT